MGRILDRMRRLTCYVGVITGLLAATGARAESVTDLAGRQVDIPASVHRIILGEGRLIYALAPLEKEHLFDRIVGWQGEFRGADTQSYDQYVAAFPQAASIA